MQFRATQSELDRLRILIQHMSRDSRIYKLLKSELQRRGHWKNLARGKPGPHTTREMKGKSNARDTKGSF